MRAGSSSTVSRRRSGSHSSYSVGNSAPTSGAPSASTKRTCGGARLPHRRRELHVATQEVARHRRPSGGSPTTSVVGGCRRPGRAAPRVPTHGAVDLDLVVRPVEEREAGHEAEVVAVRDQTARGRRPRLHATRRRRADGDAARSPRPPRTRRHGEPSQVDHDTRPRRSCRSGYSEAVFSERRCLPPASSTCSAST